MREQRTILMDVRAERRGDSDEPVLVGYAARFDDVTNIANLFDEVIRKGAFEKTISEGDDVRALHNHDENLILGRTKAGTLKLEEDENGLKVRISPPNTQQARDLMVSIERGDVDQMSFGFEVVSEVWNRAEEGKRELRELTEVRLFDVSTVVFPAYPSTSIGLRSATEVYENRPQADPSPEGESDEDHSAAHEDERAITLLEIESNS